MFKKLYILPLMLLVVGCASLGLETPKTYPERATYVEDGLAAVIASTNESIKAHAISSKDAKEVRSAVATTQEYLDAANAAFGVGDLSTAEGKIALAISALRQIQARVKP